MDFLNAMRNEQNYTRTKNGAIAHETTKSELLDFFSRAGAYRERSEADIIRAFDRSFSENALLTMKCLFYFRDIRGGQGERRLFRVIIKFLANKHPEIMEKNLKLVPEYGRWDDLYELFGTKLEEDVINLFKVQLKSDWNSENPSVLAKWLKSENTSSKTSRELGKLTRNALNLTSKEYRKMLSQLRNKINVLEIKMSSSEWETIDYDKIPSKAGLLYRKAFFRNDEERYEAFLESLKDKTKKVNSSTLYPYELVEKVLYSNITYQDQSLFDAMWQNLPNYIGDNSEESLVVADVSGSMNGRPMAVSISLAMYLSERNNGLFKDHFMTFSSFPKLCKVVGSDFTQKVMNLRRSDWGCDTNLESVFNLILNTAINNNISQNEMIKRLYIVSDMEFNEATFGRSRDRTTLFQKIKEKYKESGYEMPQLVFWNVNARNDHSPITMDENGVQLVSGCSPSIFKSLMQNEMLSAYDLMLEVLNDKRYDAVII